MAVLALGALPALAAARARPSCPGVSAKPLAASALTATSAVLRGQVNACGRRHVTAQLVYVVALGRARTGQLQSVPADRRQHAISLALTGLEPGTSVAYGLVVHTGKKTASTRRLVIRTPSIALQTIPATSMTATSAVLRRSVNDDGASGFTSLPGIAYSGGTVTVEVQKVCALPVQEAIGYSLSIALS